MARPKKSTTLFNQERKEAYIASLPVSSRAATFTMFRGTYEIEYSLNTDICKVPRAKIMELFNREFGLKQSTAKSFLNMLNNYITWCEKNSLEIGLEQHNFDFDFTYKSRKFLVASPEHLNVVLDAVLSPLENHTIDCVIRGYMWLIYMGFTPDEALEITTDDVNLKAMSIRYNKVMARIVPEAYKTIELLCNLTHFRHNRTEFQTEVIRLDGNQILRTWKKSTNARAAIRERLVELRCNEVKRLSENYVHLSGVYYRMFEFERINGVPNFTQHAREYVAYRSRKLSKPIKRGKLEQQINAAKNDLSTGYSWWRMAYWPHFDSEKSWMPDNKNKSSDTIEVKRRNSGSSRQRYNQEPADWSRVYANWKNGDISGRAAARELGMDLYVFYLRQREAI